MLALLKHFDKPPRTTVRRWSDRSAVQAHRPASRHQNSSRRGSDDECRQSRESQCRSWFPFQGGAGSTPATLQVGLSHQQAL